MARYFLKDGKRKHNLGVKDIPQEQFTHYMATFLDLALSAHAMKCQGKSWCFDFTCNLCMPFQTSITYFKSVVCISK